MKEKDLDYFKQNAEEDYIKTPISVLRYIMELEQKIEELTKQQDITSFVGCDGKVVYNEPTEIFYSERFKQQEQ
jgi:hypothetical protein